MILARVGGPGNRPELFFYLMTKVNFIPNHLLLYNNAIIIHTHVEEEYKALENRAHDISLFIRG